jgi:hypothetical protein
VLGISPASLELGVDLSAIVAAQVDRLIDLIIEEVVQFEAI